MEPAFSDSESYVDHLEIDRKDFDFEAAQRETEGKNNPKNEKKMNWMNEEQEDIDRFIFGDSSRKDKELQAKMEARKARKELREAKREEKLKKSRLRQAKRELSDKKSRKSSKTFSKPEDLKSVGKSSNADSVFWIRDEDIDDGLNWSDDEKERPALPHQSYFSESSVSHVKQERASNSKRQSFSAVPPKIKHASALSIQSSNQSLASVRTKRSECKQPSVQLCSGFEELQEDDYKWFLEVKEEEMTAEELQRYREEQTQERRQYEEYKKRLYRKKKMAETRKVFNKQELEEIRDEFEVLHNQEEVQEEGKSRRAMLGLPKQALKRLADRYGSSPATINNFYREWRFDPTLSKPLSRFERVFTYSSGAKPPKPVVARERTQKRIETLWRLVQENPFLTQEEMCAALEESEQYKEKIERAGLLRVLRMGDFRRKRVRSVGGDYNCFESVAHRAAFALHLRNYLARGFEIYFYDELILSQFYDCEYGWTRGENEIPFRHNLHINQSIVVLGLLSWNGELLWDARFGDYAPPELDEALRGFITAINKKRGAGNRLLAVNMLPYRDCKALASCFQRAGWEALFLPKHALQLNPLMGVYGDLQEHLQRRKTRNFEGLFQNTVKYLQESEEGCVGKEYLGRLEAALQRAERHDHF